MEAVLVTRCAIQEHASDSQKESGHISTKYEIAAKPGNLQCIPLKHFFGEHDFYMHWVLQVKNKANLATDLHYTTFPFLNKQHSQTLISTRQSESNQMDYLFLQLLKQDMT